MPSVLTNCPHCKLDVEIVLVAPQELSCPQCRKSLGRVGDLATIFEACALCTCRQFYAQKDFNRSLGCLIVLIGILLVPATYGLSLPVFAAVDWLLYRRTTTMVVCYRCAAEFRGFEVPARLKPFLHHIGLKYDKYR